MITRREFMAFAGGIGSVGLLAIGDSMQDVSQDQTEEKLKISRGFRVDDGTKFTETIGIRESSRILFKIDSFEDSPDMELELNAGNIDRVLEVENGELVGVFGDIGQGQHDVSIEFVKGGSCYISVFALY